MTIYDVIVHNSSCLYLRFQKLQLKCLKSKSTSQPKLMDLIEDIWIKCWGNIYNVQWIIIKDDW
jgi:hypothetical protein